MRFSVIILFTLLFACESYEDKVQIDENDELAFNASDSVYALYRINDGEEIRVDQDGYGGTFWSSNADSPKSYTFSFQNEDYTVLSVTLNLSQSESKNINETSSVEELASLLHIGNWNSRKYIGDTSRTVTVNYLDEYERSYYNDYNPSINNYNPNFGVFNLDSVIVETNNKYLQSKFEIDQAIRLKGSFKQIAYKLKNNNPYENDSLVLNGSFNAIIKPLSDN
ncbi:hypothetical protein [Ekhidna sp.]|uniref:hypothetical protein n=1 Tax=Ekhidna sp. TaxID=2608089 RepID=UPI003B505849